MRIVYISYNIKQDYLDFEKMLFERGIEGYKVKRLDAYKAMIDKDIYQLVRASTESIRGWDYKTKFIFMPSMKQAPYEIIIQLQNEVEFRKKIK